MNETYKQLKNALLDEAYDCRFEANVDAYWDIAYALHEQPREPDALREYNLLVTAYARHCPTCWEPARELFRFLRDAMKK